MKYINRKKHGMRTTVDSSTYKKLQRNNFWCTLCRANHKCNFWCESNPNRSWKWNRKTQYKTVEVWSHW